MTLKAVWSRRIPAPHTALKHGFPLPFPFNVFLTQDEIWNRGISPTTPVLWLLCRLLETFTRFGGLDFSLKALHLAQDSPAPMPSPGGRWLSLWGYKAAAGTSLLFSGKRRGRERGASWHADSHPLHTSLLSPATPFSGK